MIRILVSVFLSILIHILFLSSIKIEKNNNFKEKINKKQNIVYLKKINKKTIQTKKINKINVNALNSKLSKNKIVKKHQKLDKIIINKPLEKKITNTKNTNNKENNKKVIKEKELSEQEIKIQQKIEILRKNPYFKNWSDERIKKLELPPGMKSWEEVEKMTEYLDTQYNWIYTPPNLGNENDNKTSWKEFNINNNLQIRFLYEKTIFIAEFQEDKNIIFITYFENNNQVNENFDLPKDIKDEDIKLFEIEINKKIIDNNKNIIINEYINEIIEYYKNIKAEEKMN